MRMIAIAFVAACAIGVVTPASAAQHSSSQVPSMAAATTALKASDEISAGKRNWRNRHWHGGRKWHGNRWHGRRWHGHRGWRHRHWGWRPYYRAWRPYGWYGCRKVWRYGRRVVICR